MLRLLTKQEVTQKKSEERRREIDEGVKLSRRVDSLREIVSEEEKALKEFREKTIAEIHERIKELTTQRDELSTEVKLLERRKAEALAPILEETEQLRAVSASLDEKKEQAIIASERAEAAQHSLRELEKAIARDRGQLETLRDSVKDLYTDAEAKLANARRAELDADYVLAQAKKKETEVLKELRERDANCATKERELALKEEWLDRDRAILEKERIRLSSLRGTLERALNRLKK